MSSAILPELSIVTVTYQSARKLPGFLASAQSAAPDAECIVVDNASTDGTADIARRQGAQRIVSSPTNVGFGRACNLGAEHASGDWLLFANPDLLIESVPAIKAYDESHPFGLAGGWLSEREAAYRSSLRAEPTLPEEVLSQLFNRLVPRAVSRRTPQRRQPARWASGALLLCRKSEFLKIGGFDPRFFLYFEDRDLAARYHRKGYPLHLDPRLRGHHGHGQSAGGVQSWIQEAWSLVSWIEYRGIWHGSAAARRTARLVLSTLSTVRRLEGHMHSDRARSKAADVAHMVAFLGDLQQHLDDKPGFHPFARAALNECEH